MHNRVIGSVISLATANCLRMIIEGAVKFVAAPLPNTILFYFIVKLGFRFYFGCKSVSKREAPNDSNVQ